MDVRRHAESEASCSTRPPNGRVSFASFARHIVVSDSDGSDSSNCESAITLLAQSRRTNRDIGNHLGRTSTYVRFLGLEIGLGEQRARRLANASCLHDLGKMAMDPSLLAKADTLDSLEWELIKQHTLIGARMLTGSRCRTVRLAKVIAATHHEKWDGGGYPFGLRADQIPLASRLVTIVDQYDALRSRRAYKEPFDHSTSCSILLEGDGRTKPQHFDPQILAVFSRVLGKLEELAECTASYN